MRYARSLFLPAVSYITRRYIDVTTITVISAIEIGKGLCKRSGKTQPPASFTAFTVRVKSVLSANTPLVKRHPVTPV